MTWSRRGPTKEFEEKYGGTNFNAAQWIGRAYVDQKIALEKRKKKRRPGRVRRSAAASSGIPYTRGRAPIRCNITRDVTGFSLIGPNGRGIRL